MYRVIDEIIVPTFFFNDTATTEIYTLSLHDALPISASPSPKPMSVTRIWSDHRFVTSSRSEEHTSELQSHSDLVCRLLLEKKKKVRNKPAPTVKPADLFLSFVC